MAKHHLRLVTPATVNQTIMPRRLPNADLRTRGYLTEAEVERLLNGHCQGQPLGASGQYNAPSRVWARPTGVRGCGPAVGQVELRSASLRLRRVNGRRTCSPPLFASHRSGAGLETLTPTDCSVPRLTERLSWVHTERF
jgi:hypothetical protein